MKHDSKCVEVTQSRVVDHPSCRLYRGKNILYRIFRDLYRLFLTARDQYIMEKIITKKLT